MTPQWEPMVTNIAAMKREAARLRRMLAKLDAMPGTNLDLKDAVRRDLIRRVRVCEAWPREPRP